MDPEERQVEIGSTLGRPHGWEAASHVRLVEAGIGLSVVGVLPLLRSREAEGKQTPPGAEPGNHSALTWLRSS